jgi:hypothetical protein
MDTSSLEQLIDHQRWLLNSGLLNDEIKNQLFFCGSIVHRDVQAVECKIQPENKLVDYVIYVDKKLLKKIELYNTLSTNNTLIGMWRFRRLLKKEGSLNFQNVLGKFVSDYCGPKWVAKVQVRDFSEYVEGLGDEGGNTTSGQQLNQLPD